MPVTYDETGKMRPFGAERILVNENFQSGTLPATLTVPDGTATITKPAGGGRISVATGAVSGNNATIQTATAVGMTGFNALLIEVEGLSFDSNIVGLQLGFNGAESLYLRQDSSLSEGNVNMRVNSGTYAAGILNLLNDSEYGRRKTLGVLALRRTRELFVLLNGGIYGYAQHPTAWNSGDINPFVKLTTRSAAVRTLSIDSFKVTGWQG